MSLTQRVKQGFLRLPLMKKAILLSSLGLMLSVVMPWYDLRNSFGMGEVYLGFQGPLFILGLLVLLCGTLSFFNVLFRLMGRNFFKLKKYAGTAAAVLGGQAFLMLVVANVIFYHPDFGESVANKATRFGLVFAFVCSGILAFSGVLARRKEKELDETEEWLKEPELRLEVQPTPSSANPSSGVDPLTLDPRTRYRLLQSRARYSRAAQNNLWGGGSGSAYGQATQEDTGETHY